MLVHSWSDVQRLDLLSHKLRAQDEETDNKEEEQLVKELELFYMYGYQYFKTGFPEKAGGIYRHGLRHLEESIEVLGEKLKEVVVRIRLALSETYIAIKQLEEAAKLLEEVWVPGRTLSIDHRHKHFLWLSKLHAHLQRSSPHYSGVPEPTTSCAPLYQVRSLCCLDTVPEFEPNLPLNVATWCSPCCNHTRYPKGVFEVDPFLPSRQGR